MELDGVLEVNSLAVFVSEALRCPNPKTCFGFAQKSQNRRAKCKSYRHFRAKLKHLLRLGHLRASLRKTAKNNL